MKLSKLFLTNCPLLKIKQINIFFPRVMQIKNPLQKIIEKKKLK